MKSTTLLAYNHVKSFLAQKYLLKERTSLLYSSKRTSNSVRHELFLRPSRSHHGDACAFDPRASTNRQWRQVCFVICKAAPPKIYIVIGWNILNIKKWRKNGTPRNVNKFLCIFKTKLREKWKQINKNLN